MRKLLIALFLVLSSLSQADTKIHNLVPKELNPIREALAKHWGFLYERAAPDYADKVKKQTTILRTDIQRTATLRAIEVLRQQGHEKGQGKVLVMGGGYEVDLTPLLEEFAEVHVTDLSDEPLKLAARMYDNHPKLSLFLADLSGLPLDFQAKQLDSLMANPKKSYEDRALQLAYFEAMPEKLEPIPFKTGEYDLVISPVLVESLSHGPLVAPFEKHRADAGLERKGMSDIFGEPFFYEPAVMRAFARTYLHHSAELHRVLNAKGIATFSVWKREDLKRAELAPQIKEELLRVGDDRVSPREYEEFFKSWKKVDYRGGEQIYGKDKPPTMHMYLLEK